MIENVIFDVDGTLWDCSAAVAKAWNAVYERRGLSRRFSVSEVRSCMGLTMEEIGTIYGVSKAAVSKRLKKLHEKLKGSVI